MWRKNKLLKDKNLYYVGGVVRDEILGAASFDTDFCYEGDAIEFAKKQGLRIVKENSDFGTVRVVAQDIGTPHPQPLTSQKMLNGSHFLRQSHKGRGELCAEIDIASTREEEYPKAGHLPVVKNLGCPLKDDLKRRDFTINAMAKNTLTNEIVDYFGGMDDIRNKKLRVLHSQSFIDDPTRIVRALKFSVRFGFALDEETKKLQNEYLSNINYDMSYHRLKKELKETFSLNKEEAYKKFINDGIYKLLSNDVISSKLAEGVCAKLVEKYNPANPWLVWLGNFDLSNLELTAEEKNIIDSVPDVKPKSDFELYKLFKDLPLESILLYALHVDYNLALHYLDDLKNIRIETSGNDLKSMGFKQGKIYKEIFDLLLEEKIRNPHLTKQDEIQLIRGKYGI